MLCIVLCCSSYANYKTFRMKLQILLLLTVMCVYVCVYMCIFVCVCVYVCVSVYSDVELIHEKLWLDNN